MLLTSTNFIFVLFAVTIIRNKFNFLADKLTFRATSSELGKQS